MNSEKNSKKSSTNQSWLWKYLIWPCFIFIFEDKIALIYEMGYFLGNNAQYILKENKLKMKSWHVVPSSYVMAVASKTKVIRQNMRLESRLSSALEKREKGILNLLTAKSSSSKLALFSSLSHFNRVIMGCIFLIDAQAHLKVLLFVNNFPLLFSPCIQIGIH